MNRILEKSMRVSVQAPLRHFDVQYEKACGQLERLSARLRKLWRTKKTSMQLIKEERIR